MGVSEDVARLNPDYFDFGDARLKLKGAKKAGRDLGKIHGRRVDSQLEARAWRDLPGIIESAFDLREPECLFKPFTLYLEGGVAYTPDMAAYHGSRRRALVFEVKPDWTTHPSSRSARRAIKAAADRFGGIFEFWGITPSGPSGWELEEF